ncbi:hypothetical protein D3C87_1545670 [compost metagenome]
MRLMLSAASVAQVWAAATMSANRPLTKSLLRWMVLKLAVMLSSSRRLTVLTFLTQLFFDQVVSIAEQISCFQSEKTVKLS